MGQAAWQSAAPACSRQEAAAEVSIKLPGAEISLGAEALAAISGADGKFMPGKNALRSETAQMFKNFMQLMLK